MTDPAPRDLMRPGVRHAIGVLFLHTARDLLRRRRHFLFLALFFLPLGVALALEFWGSGGGRREFEEGMLREAFPWLAVLPALLFGTSMVAREVDERTITFLFVRPLPKFAIFVGKYLATGVVLTAAATAAFAGFFAVAGFHGIDQTRYQAMWERRAALNEEDAVARAAGDAPRQAAIAARRAALDPRALAEERYLTALDRLDELDDQHRKSRRERERAEKERRKLDEQFTALGDDETPEITKRRRALTRDREQQDRRLEQADERRAEVEAEQRVVAETLARAPGRDPIEARGAAARYLGILIAGVWAYLALFGALGAALRFPMILGIIYAVVVQLLVQLPFFGRVKYLAVDFHLSKLIHELVLRVPDDERGLVFVSYTTGEAWTYLGAFAGGGILIACAALHRREYRLRQ